ncbi:MAG: PAS domain S-box protein [Elusimicrobiota bacterium]
MFYGLKSSIRFRWATLRASQSIALTALFAAFLAGVWIMSAAYLRLEYAAEVRVVASRLEAAGEARMRESQAWLRDRENEAHYVARSSALAGALRGDTVSRRQFTEEIEHLRGSHNYSAFCLLDAAGALRLSTRGSADLCRAAGKSGIAVFQSKEFSILLHGKTPETSMFGFCSRAPGLHGPRVCGWSPLAGAFLQIFRQEQPGLESGETLLVCSDPRDGSILFLTPVKFRTDDGEFLRLSAERREVAAWSALKDPSPFRSYLDYRGERVFASTLRMPMTGWGVVRKLDRSEALKRFWTHALLLLVAALSLTGMCSLLLSLFRREQHRRRLDEELRRLREREAAQRAVNDVERQRLLLIDSMLNGFAQHEIILDAGGRPCDYRFLDVNQSFERLTGLRRAQVLGRTVREVLPGIEDEFIQRYGKVALTGVPDSFVSASAQLGKTYEVYVYRTSPLHFAVLFNDVTERMRTHEDLRKSEQRFRAALEASAVSVWEQDGALRYTWIHNHPLHDPKTSIGRSDEELLSPEDREKIVPEKLHALREGRLVRDMVFLTIRGENRAFDRRLEPLRAPDGSVRGLLGVAVDVTEQMRALRVYRESEARLRALVECTPVAIGIFSSESIELANEPFARLFGFKSPDDAIGTDPAVLFAERVRPDMERTFHRRLKGGDAPAVYETLARRVDGSVFPMLVQAGRTVLKDAPVVIVHLTDLTERKRLEEQLRQSQKMDAVGRLAGGVAHDFNNILTAIQGYAEMLHSQFPADDPRREDLKEILDASERATALTQQLLAFSRRQVLAPIVLNPNGPIEKITRMLQRLLGEDIKLTLQLDPELDCVRIDPGQFEQVLMNLAVNARDAMPRGGSLAIGTTNVLIDEEFVLRHPGLAPGPCVQLFVSDSGKGIPREQLERLFEPFNTTKEKGTGLGLATVYGIVRQSGGIVEAESAPEMGTVFKIYLPACAAPPGAAPGLTGTAVKLPGGSETVLLVEDEAVVRKLARRILEKACYKVIEAKSGDEALRLAGEHSGEIDLLLTDVVMPGMSGRELGERIAPLRPRLKKLYMSGYTDDAILRHGVLEQGIPFLQKPFSRQSLLTALRRVLDDAPN